MPRVTRTTASSKQKKGGKGSWGAGASASAILPTDQPSLQELVDIRATNEEMYGQPERTWNTYKGYIKNGKEFLARLIEKRQREDITAEDKLETDGLEKAFDDNKPNRYSATALELFLTQKCLSEGNGLSTAHGIQAAWASRWDKM